MKIDFEKYKVEFPKKPGVAKLRRPNNRYYKRKLRAIKRGLPRL